jgi:Uri superfamily endonuclease
MPDCVPFGSSAGTYAILLEVLRPQGITVGALGHKRFEAGAYLYVGSARGSGGLRARIAHHRRVTDRPHWHIDYLRRHARITMVWVSAGLDRMECEWLSKLADLGALDPGVPGFGASDCHCRTHLLTTPRLEPGLIRKVSERLHPAVATPVRWS